MQKEKQELTHERLVSLLCYHANGTFTWRIDRGNQFSKQGALAGSTRKDGYHQIFIDGRHYATHRLAWLYVFGKWPETDLDHINLDKRDNRIENLRAANDSQNCANRKKPSGMTSRYKGVHYEPDRRTWRASIRHNYKLINIGRFKSEEEAGAAYDRMALRLFGAFARPNFVDITATS